MTISVYDLADVYLSDSNGAQCVKYDGGCSHNALKQDNKQVWSAMKSLDPNHSSSFHKLAFRTHCAERAFAKYRLSGSL